MNELVIDILAGAFMGIGCLFAVTGSLGVLRMPDFYSRLHPAGKSDTLAQALILVGLAIAFWGEPLVVEKIILIILVLFVTAPTATHAITKAARLDGLKPLGKDIETPNHHSEEDHD